jgi:UDPglucose 6-dehydrogenase
MTPSTRTPPDCPLCAADEVAEIYESFTKAPIVRMSIVSAEATKVFYNSFITAKICFANTWMEICHRIGADVDDVCEALSKGTKRVISPKYLQGGMADAGPCHPRDLIALSWLSRELLSYDLFGDLMRVREKQTEWLAGICAVQTNHTMRKVMILGKAYKKGTNLTSGSAATLLRGMLDKKIPVIEVDQWDPHVDPPREFAEPAVFVIATNHDEFYAMQFPVGSVVVDPWGQMEDREGCKVIRVGRGDR